MNFSKLIGRRYWLACRCRQSTAVVVFALLSAIPSFGQMCTASAETIPGVPLPNMQLFTEVDEQDLNDVIDWASNVEAWYITEKHEILASGEYGRTANISNREITFLKSVQFRLAENATREERRVICSQQDLLGNSQLLSSPGMPYHDDQLRDYLLTGEDAFLGGGPSEALNISLAQAVHLNRGQPVFHPLRACVCGFDQILGGGAMRIDDHAVNRRAIKATHRSGAHLHVLVSLTFGDTAHSVNRIITFADKRPIQWDAFSVDPQTSEPIVYESTRTVWKDFNKRLKLPVKLYAVRDHRVRPGEMYFELDWLVGDQISEGLFTKETVGQLSAFK